MRNGLLSLEACRLPQGCRYAFRDREGHNTIVTLPRPDLPFLSRCNCPYRSSHSESLVDDMLRRGDNLFVHVSQRSADFETHQKSPNRPLQLKLYMEG